MSIITGAQMNMKCFVIFLILMGVAFSFLTPQILAYSSEELFYGSSSFEKIPTSVIPGSLTEFEIKFRYITGPYALSNFSTVIEISPASASSKVRVDVEPIEGISHGQVVRIPVTITVDPGIEHEKIFLSVYFTGEHFLNSSDVFYKSAWIDSATIDIESSPPPGLSLLTNPPQHTSPLKQFKIGVPPDQIQCKNNLQLILKHNGSPACVKPKTAEKLIERGWAST